jgi:hypothetical protein
MVLRFLVGKQVSVGDTAEGIQKEQECKERFLILELGKLLWRFLFHVHFQRCMFDVAFFLNGFIAGKALDNVKVYYD